MGAARLAVGLHEVLELHLRPDRRVGAAVLLGPGHGEPAALAELLAEVLGEELFVVVAGREVATEPGGDVLAAEGVDLLAEVQVFLVPGEFHAVSPRG